MDTESDSAKSFSVYFWTKWIVTRSLIWSSFLHSDFLFNFVPSIFLVSLVFIKFVSLLSYKQGYFLTEFTISLSSRKFIVFLPIFFTFRNIASSWFTCFIQINQLWLSNSFRILNIVDIWIDSLDHSDRTIFKSDRIEKILISIAFKNRT